MRRSPPPAPPLGVVVAVVLAAALLTACPSGSGGARRDGPTTRADRPEPAPDPPGQLDWRDCGEGTECASLEVPLDYGDPDGRTIELALRRRPAGGDDPIGSLLVNPGGPGASGVDLLPDIAGILPAELQRRFDVVGWDTRGVGDSAPVECDDADLDRFFAADSSPDDAAEVEALRAAAEALVAGCEPDRAGELAFLSSDNTARDMDRIRAALGDERLSYLGFSYGTFLGALYAEEFPERVRAMVLDGAVDPSLDYAAFSEQQALGFERSLQLFLDDCSQSRSCAFHNGGRAGAAYDALMARIDAEGLPTRERGRRLTPGLADLGVATTLYGGELGWELLAQALADAQDGDGTTLLDLADEYTERLPDGSYRSNMQDAFFAISCVDSPVPRDPQAFSALAERVGEAAPHFGATTAYLGFPCVYWPAPGALEPAPVRAPGAPPIVVIGATDDPATPLANAEALAAQLGDGVLVVVDSAQHTSFPAGDACLDDAVVEYLVRLVPPRDGLRCG